MSKKSMLDAAAGVGTKSKRRGAMDAGAGVGTTACTTCPKRPSFACDVETLEISARAAGASADDARTISASRRMREALDEATRRSYPAHIHKHLQNFDIILDCTAGFKDNYFLTTDSPETVQQLSAVATFHKAGNCPTREHQKISAKVVSGASTRLTGSTKHNTTQLMPWSGDDYVQNAVSIRWPPSNETRSFQANSIFQGSARETTDFTFLFFFFFALMDTKAPKAIQVIAEGHGTRIDKNQVRRSLRGLIRIYREDTFKAVFAYNGGGKEREVEPPDNSLGNDPNANAMFQQIVGTRPQPSGRRLVAKAQQTARSAKRGFVDFVKGVKPAEPGVSFQIQLNNQSVELDREKTEKLQQFLAKAKQWNLVQYLPDLRGGNVKATLGLYFAVLWTLAVDSLKQKLKKVLTALKNCVKCGLWLELEFRWIDGIAGFKYATKEGKSYPRYKSIVHGFSFFFELNMLHLSFSLNYGVKAKFGAVAGVWAYCYVRIEFLAQFNGEVSLDSENAGTTGWGLVSEGELALGATAGAQLLGAGVTVSAEGRATLRFKFAISISNDPSVKTKYESSLSLSPITFDYHAQVHVPGLPKGENHGQWQPWGSTSIPICEGEVG